MPQYHSIPENDEWWGKGFTDWKNVAKGKKRFIGHYQPHIPTELGYYDLSDDKTRIAQAELANKYGVSGFCYYHYWFNEKLLLEMPLNEVLKSGKPNFPFCLCWANENWTRRWDGLENEILIGQKYDEYSPKKHMQWLSNAFNDNRYIKINGKPLFLIYNISGIPDLSNKINSWRRIAAEMNLPGIYLCSVKSVHNKFTDKEVIDLGFDAIVDFIPGKETFYKRKVLSLPKYYSYLFINKLISALKLERLVKKLAITSVYSYGALANEKMNKLTRDIKTFECIIPNWDNSSRKRIADAIQNDNPDIYQRWLENALLKTKSNSPEEQIVFINAWNEWAEGCHLEPDLRNGKMFLEATLKAVNAVENKAS